MPHVIFDWDGPLVDSFQTNLAIMQALDPGVCSEQYRYNHHLGNVHHEPAIQLTDAQKHEFVRQYQSGIGVEHLRAARPHLRELSETHSLHIVTSNGEPPILSLLEASGLGAAFSSVLGYYFSPSKVDKLRWLVEENLLDPTRTPFVTDTIGDLREAKIAGFQTIAVSFGYHTYEELAAENPAHLVSSWPELRQLID